MKNFSVRAFMSTLLLFPFFPLVSQVTNIESFNLNQQLGPHQIYVDGYTIWLATDNGVYSFDGKNLSQQFTSNNGLPHNVTYGITKDVHGVFWFRTAGGVAKKKATQWQYIIYDFGGFPMIKRLGDDLWLSMMASEPYYFSDLYRITKTDSTVYASNFESMYELIDIESASSGYYAINNFGDKGIVKRIDNNELSSIHVHTDPVYDVTVTHDTVFVATGNGFLKKNPDSDVYNYITNDFFASTAVTKIIVRDDGVIYFGTRRNGIIYMKDNVLKKIGTAEGLPDGAIVDMASDVDQNLWVIINDRVAGTNHLVKIRSGKSENKVSGLVFEDYDRDGIQDAEEPGISNQFLQIHPSGFFAVTNNDGTFSIHAEQGMNTLICQNEFWTPSTPLNNTFSYPEAQPHDLMIGLYPTITSIEDELILKDVLYPNPSQGTFAIREEYLDKFSKATLTTTTGRQIETQAIKGSTIHINITPGLYLLRLEGKAKATVCKVVIVN